MTVLGDGKSKIGSCSFDGMSACVVKDSDKVNKYLVDFCILYC